MKIKLQSWFKEFHFTRQRKGNTQQVESKYTWVEVTYHMYILLVETTSLHPLVETYFVFSSSSLWCDVICDCPHRKGKLLVEVTDFSLPSFFCITFSLPIITSYTHSTLIFDRSTKATSTLKTMYFCRAGYFLKIFSNYTDMVK